MCGIAGLFSAVTSDYATHRMKLMLDSIEHRGPDDEGLVCKQVSNKALALGARRLAIQDLSSAGHQPMQDERTGNILVFNGEIYNAPALRKELRGLGQTFIGGSDTEVILRSYQQWGRQAITRLRGMFALAIWDASDHELILARDPLGIKPLYFSRVGSDLVFASEIRALRTSGVIARELDHEGLSDYLAFGSVQDPRTIYRDIESLPAGHMLCVHADGSTPAQIPFWTLPDVTPVAPDDAVQRGRELLTKGVNRHLLSDVPVGIFLSSGLDSSLVLGLAARESIQDVSAFTVSFPGLDNLDEGPLAARIAKESGVPHTECILDSDMATAWTIDALGSMDQPSADGLNTYIVSRAVREQGLKVALSGLGGDEMFGGYPSFRQLPAAQRALKGLSLLPASWRSAAARAVAAKQGEMQREKMVDMAGGGPDLCELFLRARRLFPDSWLRRFGVQAPLVGSAERGMVVPGDPIASVARLETSTYLRNTLLRDSDVFGMANSLEIRVPMLDQDLAEWALSLPGDVLLPREAPPKHLLRRMFPELLLDEQTTQKKKGFVLPIGPWLDGPLSEIKEGSLAALTDSGAVDEGAIAAFEQVHRSESSPATGSRLWALVVLGRWFASSPRT